MKEDIIIDDIIKKAINPDEKVRGSFVYQRKVDDELSKYGTKIKGGYVMTVGQILNYFEDIRKRSLKKERR